MSNFNDSEKESDYGCVSCQICIGIPIERLSCSGLGIFGEHQTSFLWPWPNPDSKLVIFILADTSGRCPDQ